jgi:hypothetical protein
LPSPTAAVATGSQLAESATAADDVRREVHGARRSRRGAAFTAQRSRCGRRGARGLAQLLDD